MEDIEAQMQPTPSQSRVTLGRVNEWIRYYSRQVAFNGRWTSRPALGKWAIEVQALLVFLVGFGFHAYLAPYGIDPHHDGIMFKPALDVSQGKMVFRDTFTQYGGVTVLLQAAALKLFGAKLIVIRIQTAVMYGLGFLLFWRVWRRLMPSVVATSICLIGAVLGPDSIAMSLPWSSVYALVFQGLTLLWAVRFFENGRERELVYSGAAAAIAFWCRQPVGALLAAGTFLALVIVAARMSPAYSTTPGVLSVRTMFPQNPWGRIGGIALLFGGGVLLVNALILAWLAHYGALLDWWKQSILFAVVFAKGRSDGQSFEPILACLFPAGHLRVWCLVGVGVAIQALRFTAPFLDPRSAIRESDLVTALLASVVAMTSWFQYFPVACNYHCYWAGIPMLGVFIHLFYSTHTSSSRVTRSLITVAVMGIVFYNDASLRIESVEPHIASQNVEIRSVPAFRGMRTNGADAVNYAAVQSLIEAYLRVHPDGTIVTTTGNGLFPTLTNRQASYHPMYMAWEQMNPLYPDANAKRAKYIKEKLPMIVGPGEVPPTHVYVGHITWHGVGNNILVPKDTHPTEILECDGGGTCKRRPILAPKT